jgi:GT2 family glycosyltransferase
VLPASLTVSIVTHHPDLALLERCLGRLASALGIARETGALGKFAVALIDNSEDRAVADSVYRLGQACLRDSGAMLTLVQGHANIGYGAANNLMLHGTGSDYQLVLNPDIELAPDAIANVMRWLDARPEIGAVAAAVTAVDGTPLFLCRRYPAVLDLALRGFAPRFVRKLFDRRLAHYELRDRIDPASKEPVLEIPLMSGACMFVRRSAIDATGGFDPDFFLYFEDYDWSVRLDRVTKTAYLPAMRAIHHGGGAARKGLRHIGWFARSAYRFYGKHGWRWF